jgi:transposase
VCDGEGTPVVLLLTEGQMSDHKGARLILDALPPAQSLIADRGYDSNWFDKPSSIAAPHSVFRRPSA